MTRCGREARVTEGPGRPPPSPRRIESGALLPPTVPTSQREWCERRRREPRSSLLQVPTEAQGSDDPLDAGQLRGLLAVLEFADEPQRDARYVGKLRLGKALR